MGSITENLTKVDNIKENLWPQVQDKVDFIKKCSADFGRSANTINNHWFGRFWSIPQDLVDDIIVYMQNYIANQPKKS